MNSLCCLIHNLMKKQRILILLLIIIFAAACRKTEKKGAPPTLQFKVDTAYVYKDDTVLVGKTFKVGIIANKGDDNITNFIIKVSNDSTITYLDTGLNASSLNLSETIIKGVSLKDTWTFIARDKDGSSASISLTGQ
jgi:hypothetical protein